MAQLDTTPPTAFFVRGPSPLTRLSVFGMLSIALMILDAQLHYLTEIRQGFAAMIRPLEVVASAPLDAADFVGDYLVSQVRLVEDNRRLQLRHLQQQADLQRFRLLERENAHLRRLLDASQASALVTRVGEIVYSGRDVFSRKVVVNVGERNGIKAGLAVIDESGVVGQVTRAYPFTSEVTLVTNKDLAVPIQVERTGLRAIAFGLGRDNLIGLPYLPPNVDIQQGDKLVTSGIDGVYPPGLAVARVTQVERQADSPFARITCVPLAGIDIHRQVLVVMAFPALAERTDAVAAPPKENGNAAGKP